jgi:hypothetical protein
MLGFTPFAAAPFADLGSGDVNVSVTGVSAAGQLGDVLVVAPANVFPNGVAATAELGDISIFITIVAEVTGVEATGGAFPEEEIHDLVGNPVANLVGMAFGDRFTGEKIAFTGHKRLRWMSRRDE